MDENPYIASEYEGDMIPSTLQTSRIRLARLAVQLALVATLAFGVVLLAGPLSLLLRLPLGYIAAGCVCIGIVTSLTAVLIGDGQVRVAAGAIGLVHGLVFWDWLWPGVARFVTG